MRHFISITALILGLFAFTSLKAQDIAKDETYTVCCQVYAKGNKVELVFGNEVDFLKDKKSILSDEQGRPIVFKKGLDAVNYLLKRGWKFEQMAVDPIINTQGSEKSWHIWILSKEVSCEEDILEGIHTAKVVN